MVTQPGMMQMPREQKRLGRGLGYASANVAGLLVALLWPAASLGCGGPKVVRGSQDPAIDDVAFGTGLDRRDLQKMLNENLDGLWKAPITQRWRSEARPPVAVLGFRNETSEHIESALNALISDVETELINSGEVRVVSLENQQQLMGEIRRQHSEGFDKAQVANWGQQLGVRYIVTGKVFTTDERAANARRVQYYLFLQILDVETSEVLFQKSSTATKAIVS